MKKSIYTITILVLATTFAVQAAADVKKKTTVESSSDGSFRFGLGFTTYNNVAAPGALSGWLDLSPKLSLQPWVAIAMSDPFAFNLGTYLRVTLHGNQSNGFHAGGGFDLGSLTKTFFLNITPIVGFHFAVTSSLEMAFDGGLNFHVTPSPFQLALASLSGHAGASIHYFF